MKIVIVGAGAMGGAIGGLLTEAGLDVTLIDVWKEHVDAMNKYGLKLTEPSTERLVKVHATTDCTEVGPVDLIILMVKSYHTEEAIKNVVPIIQKKTVVLTLQNGLGNEEKLTEILGKERVLSGVTMVGGVLTKPGEVYLTREGKSTCIGELDGRITDRVNELVKLFNQAGLETIATDNVYKMIWSKNIGGVAVKPLSAITGLPVKKLLEVDEITECALEAIEEAIRVAKAGKVELVTEVPAEIWSKMTTGATEKHKSSMLQDVERGRKTEIESVSGIIVKLGKEYKIPTPVNKTLVAAVKGIELQKKA